MLHTIQNNLTKEGEEMELKTRYQYTYFIYPYVIEQSKYSKYLQNLLRNKKCTLRMFEKQKDLDIYNKFLPKVRRFMFPTFDFSENKRKKFKELDVGLQSTILQKYPCTIFEYNLGKNAQGKAGRNTGIFFKIDKIEIICFYTGECFITLKTSVEDLEQFDDVLNFNYKFKDIKSEFISMKQFDNIKIQTSEFDDVRKITEVIDEIVGNYTKNINIDTNKFLTYSYSDPSKLGYRGWYFSGQIFGHALSVVFPISLYTILKPEKNILYMQTVALNEVNGTVCIYNIFFLYGIIFKIC